MNEAAPYFFRIVQHVLLDDVLLHIARLTDPAKQGSYENLSVCALPESISDQALAKEISDLVKAAVDHACPMRTQRNKRLAHTDRALITNPQVVPMPGVSRSQIETVLRDLRGILNCLHVHYTGGEFAFDRVRSVGNAEGLLFQLAVASRYEERARQRLAEGKLLPEDLEPPPEI